MSDRKASALAVAVGSLLIFAFLGQLLPVLVLGIKKEEQAAPLLHWILLFSPLAGIACVLLARSLGALPPNPRAKVPMREAVAVALGAGVLALAGSIAIVALQAKLGVVVKEQKLVVEALRSGPHRVLLIVGIALLVPIGEELVFRRLGFAAILERHGKIAAYGWSVAVFSVIHMNPPGFANYAWIGLVTAVAYHRTGRIFVPIVVHAINNGVAALST